MCNSKGSPNAGFFATFVLCCLFSVLFMAFLWKDVFMPGRNTPVIFVITPTYRRPTQIADLTRLSQALALAGGIHWIVVEDAHSLRPLVQKFLDGVAELFVGVTYLSTPSFKETKRLASGFTQRNAALQWLRDTQFPGDSLTSGPIVYFADDDNTYDHRIFARMRQIKRFGVWPVGLVAPSAYEGPICDDNKRKIIGFRTLKADRFCPCDMAAFAFRLSLLFHRPSAIFQVPTVKGLLETQFVEALLGTGDNSSLSDNRFELFEPLVCDRLLVWHTRTEKPPLTGEQWAEERFGLDISYI